MPVKYVFDETGALVIQTRIRPLAEMPTDEEMLERGRLRAGVESTEDWNVVQVDDNTYRLEYRNAAQITRDIGTGELVVVPRVVTPVSMDELARQTRVKEIDATTPDAWAALTTEQKTALLLEYFEKAILRIA